MIDKFKKAKNEESGDNWLICWTGQDAEGNHFNVTTNCVHGSSLHNYTRGAEGDAELIARLLNWYYNDQDAAEQRLHMDGGDSPAKPSQSTLEGFTAPEADTNPPASQ